MPAATGDHLSPPLCHEQPTICSFSGSLRRFVCLCSPVAATAVGSRGVSISADRRTRRVQTALGSLWNGPDVQQDARLDPWRWPRPNALSLVCALAAPPSSLRPPLSQMRDGRGWGRDAAPPRMFRAGNEPLWVMRSPTGGSTNACRSQNAGAIAAVAFSPVVRAHLPAAGPCLIAERVASVPLLDPSEPPFHPRRFWCPAPTTKVRCCCFAQVAVATVIVMP